ncbi:MAG: hypothetical protein QJR14_07765 [Bacillota bacterium]|nr:hypothetical protein [Bacillota bacterium]
MDETLIDRWVRARQAFTAAQDIRDKMQAGRAAEAALRAMAEIELRMTEEERREAWRRFEAWFRRYLASA